MKKTLMLCLLMVVFVGCSKAESPERSETTKTQSVSESVVEDQQADDKLPNTFTPWTDEEKIIFKNMDFEDLGKQAATAIFMAGMQDLENIEIGNVKLDDAPFGYMLNFSTFFDFPGESEDTIGNWSAALDNDGQISDLTILNIQDLSLTKYYYYKDPIMAQAFDIYDYVTGELRYPKTKTAEEAFQESFDNTKIQNDAAAEKFTEDLNEILEKYGVDADE